jgi:PAS domain-containing protein
VDEGNGACEDIGSGREHAQASAILDAALDAVITIDHEGRVLDFNRAAEETLGYRSGAGARRADRPRGRRALAR